MTDELVDIIDSTNNVLHSISKKAAHEQGLLHRTVIGEVRDTKGNWVLVRQSQDRQDAGQYVSPVGGHVRAGETEVEALKRETLEEIGLTDFAFDHIGDFIFDRKVLGRHENHYFIIYRITTDRPFVLGDEADDYKSFTEASLREQIKQHPSLFGAAFYAVLHKFYGHMLPD